MSKSLKEFLVECKDAYYAGNPIISDAEYDHLEEICNEDLSVGTNRGRTRHWFRMYSLEKYYIGEEFPVWQTGVYMEDETDTPKLDGAAIALRYIDGDFDSVVTRGNGEYGEDISHLFEKDNLYKLNIPETIQLRGTVQITGEIVAPKYINNARNYAAGAINLKDSAEFWTKELTFIAYGVQPFMSETYSYDMGILVNEGFETVTHCDYLDDFPQDGRVVRLDNNAKYIDAGFTSKHPKGAFEVKERTEGVKTKILEAGADQEDEKGKEKKGCAGTALFDSRSGAWLGEDAFNFIDTA